MVEPVDLGLGPGSSENLHGCWSGISVCLEFETKKAAFGSIALCIHIITGFFTLKNEQKPEAQFDKGSAGELQDAAGSSSPAWMMDVTGRCEKGSQMPIAFRVLALAGRVQLDALAAARGPSPELCHLSKATHSELTERPCALLTLLSPRGLHSPSPSQLLALDALTEGAKIWEISL
ncbi:hypothetical protein H920_07934 [Fukomys damarensis]|uniref:Uncharacterized protein n=1 Tax=Fukomys damarensis TaxID=885580 RepID=A0A091DF19_FUKDA|nr:hypothetical protein H920_07934 [Fukomys damarensis]